MNQSSFMAGTIAIAFLIFITVRGELPKYTAVLVGGSTGGGGSGSGGNGASGGGGSATSNPAKAGGLTRPITGGDLKDAATRLDDTLEYLSGGKIGLYGGDWAPSTIVKKVLGF